MKLTTDLFDLRLRAFMIDTVIVGGLFLIEIGVTMALVLSAVGDSDPLIKLPKALLVQTTIFAIMWGTLPLIYLGADVTRIRTLGKRIVGLGIVDHSGNRCVGKLFLRWAVKVVPFAIVFELLLIRAFYFSGTVFEPAPGSGWILIVAASLFIIDNGAATCGSGLPLHDVIARTKLIVVPRARLRPEGR